MRNQRDDKLSDRCPENCIDDTKNAGGTVGDTLSICSHSAHAGETIWKHCPALSRRPHRARFRGRKKCGDAGFNFRQMCAVLNLTLLSKLSKPAGEPGLFDQPQQQGSGGD